MCNEKEISALRASVGALAWLAKETRPDLAGRVALLQQAFPKPRVLDLLEANSLTQEAKETASSGIILMLIPVGRLRVGVATDASWGNSGDRQQLEDNKEDFGKRLKPSGLDTMSHRKEPYFIQELNKDLNFKIYFQRGRRSQVMAKP